ncbi:ExbD/TolR family protein [Hephaestia sp. GCM10023244]|uniref:ExbD/TolR family protein n=1 Tax=unclassified Hephaestia TaxID=2631281 RepID=UPI00207705A0|nr:biopolymer transporter ExbD [Hephaestia sp. MAHUQ-44]MCM8731758.1 biopolymer transporter ExbD [Hephaestia sp. MAHUQ-44]
MRHRPVFAAPAEPVPVFAINITPLIDVLLVLLVMMILTIPTMMHEVPIDLPQPGPVAVADRVTHELAIARDGGLTLDGAPASDAALIGRLAVQRADPANELVMRTDPDARYDRFARVLADVKRAGVTRLGFVGNATMVE